MQYEDNLSTSILKRGEIHYIESYVSVGRAISPKSGRPAIILSNTSRNMNSGTVEVVYLSHSDGVNSKGNPVLEDYNYGKVINSVVVCSQVHTVDKNLVGDFITNISEKDLSRVEECVCKNLGVNLDLIKNNILIAGHDEPKNEDGFYKRMYFELIDHIRGEDNVEL